MKALSLALAAALLAALPHAAPAAPIPLADLSRYLNGITTAAADFTQINADGTISLGHLTIKRPGQVRFEYAPPDATLVLASAGQVAVFDAKSNEPPEEYPLDRTPLNLILAPDIDLSRADMVKSVSEDGPKTVVVAQDPDHPEYGSIELVFTANPTVLRQWVVTDDSGARTTVILGELAPLADPGSMLFNIPYETQRRMER